MTPVEQQLQKHLFELALQCRIPACRLKGDRVIEHLEEIFPENFIAVEEDFLKLQKEYWDQIVILRKLPDAIKRSIHACITAQTEFRRFSALGDHFNQPSASIQDEIDEKGDASQALQRRIENGSKRRHILRERRKKVQDEGRVARERLAALNELRTGAADKAIRAKVRAGFAKSTLEKKLTGAAGKAFLRLAALIEKRENLRVKYFMGNGWPLLLVDCRVQNAFDAAIRSAAEEPSCWDRVCGLFKHQDTPDEGLPSTL